MHTDFDSLIGQVLPYFGVDNNCFKLGDQAWEAVEDESDGYRSMMEAVRAVDGADCIFFSAPIARVRVEEADQIRNPWGDNSFDYDSEGYRLVDVDDGHVWLEFGTRNRHDYYPCFTFNHWPKEPPASLTG